MGLFNRWFRGWVWDCKSPDSCPMCCVCDDFLPARMPSIRHREVRVDGRCRHFKVCGKKGDLDALRAFQYMAQEDFFDKR